MKKLILFCMIILILTSSGYALEKPSQRSNKIYLKPYYRPHLTRNQPYKFEVIVNPQDGITSVLNAMITFNLYLNPTVSFSLVAERQDITSAHSQKNLYCNPKSFLVHTTYANAGWGTISFDCSNVITKEGKYIFILVPSKDTGSIYGWLDLTYLNKPAPSIRLKGTEYNAGDYGKIFLQLLDSNDQAITNATCFTTVYYPDNDLWYENHEMHYLDNGLYYEDVIVPYQLGVYMLSAKCFIPTLNETIFNGYDDLECGGWNCGNGWADAWSHSGGASVGGTAQQGSYGISFAWFPSEISRHINITTQPDLLTLSFYARANSLETGDNIYFYFCDNSSNCSLQQIWVDGNDDNLWHHFSFSFEPDNYNLSGNVKLVFNTSSSFSWFDYFYLDTFNFTGYGVVNNSYYVITRGNGELHVQTGNNPYVLTLTKVLYETNDFEGTLLFNYSLQSLIYQTELETTITFPFYYDLPCNELLFVKKQNGSTWTELNASYTWEDSHCSVNIVEDLEPLEITKYAVKFKNFYKRSLFNNYQSIILRDDFIRAGCYWYRDYYNLSDYSVPITNISSVDNQYDACLSYLDMFYKFNNTYNEFMNITNISTENQFLNYYTLYRDAIRLEEQTNTISNGIILHWLTSNAYPQAILDTNLTENWTKLWAETSGNYHIAELINNLTCGGNATCSETYALSLYNCLKNGNCSDWWINSSFLNLTDGNTLMMLLLNKISNNQTFWFPYLNVSINSSVNYNLIPQFVWNYSNRSADVNYYAIKKVSGTEYTVNDNGKVVAQFVRVLFGIPIPINNADCNVTIYYPNESVFISNQTATYIPNSNGLYSYNFTVPNIIGVYTIDFNCRSGLLRTYGSGTFHVSPSSNLTNIDYDLVSSYVWNYTNRTLTFIDWDTGALYVWNSTTRTLTYYNQSYSASIQSCLEDGNCIGWWINDSFINLTLNDLLMISFLNKISNNQTFWFPYLNNTIHQQSVNYTLMAQYIWTYQNRNLTFIDWDTGALYVWNSTTRTLTYYNQSYSASIQSCLEDGNCIGWWINDSFINLTENDRVIYNLLNNVANNQTFWFPYLNNSIHGLNTTQLQWLPEINSTTWTILNQIKGFFGSFDIVSPIYRNESITVKAVFINQSGLPVQPDYFNFSIFYPNGSLFVSVNNSNFTVNPDYVYNYSIKLNNTNNTGSYFAYFTAIYHGKTITLTPKFFRIASGGPYLLKINVTNSGKWVYRGYHLYYKATLIDEGEIDTEARCKVWVDTNNNEKYDSFEPLDSFSKLTKALQEVYVTGDILIPGSHPTGYYNLRIICDYDSSAQPPSYASDYFLIRDIPPSTVGIGGRGGVGGRLIRYYIEPQEFRIKLKPNEKKKINFTIYNLEAIYPLIVYISTDLDLINWTQPIIINPYENKTIELFMTGDTEKKTKLSTIELFINTEDYREVQDYVKVEKRTILRKPKTMIFQKVFVEEHKVYILPILIFIIGSCLVLIYFFLIKGKEQKQEPIEEV